MTIALALVAALCLGSGFVLQQRAASRAPVDEMLRFRLLLRLVHSPQWLTGIGFMVAGQILSAIALSLTSVTLVEPLLAANLLVALFLASLVSRQPFRRSDWGGCLILGAGLAAFILAGNPTVHHGPVSDVRQWSVIGGIAAIGLVLVAVSRLRPLYEQSTMLAGAAGSLAGLQDGFTRSTLLTFQSAPARILVDWHVYTLLGVGIIVILLQQSAFKAGSLRHALPAFTAAEPLSGIAFGIVAFGDQVRTTPLALAGQAAGLAAMVVGVYIVATSRILNHAVGETDAASRHDTHGPDDARHRAPGGTGGKGDR